MVVGRRYGKAWPTLPLIIPPKSELMADSIVQRCTGGISKHGSLKRVRTGITLGRNSSNSNEQLYPNAKLAPSIDSVSGSDQVGGFHVPLYPVPM